MYNNTFNSNRKNTEPITGKQAAIGLGILAIVGIGAAILGGSSDEKNKNNNSSVNKVATSPTSPRKLP